MNRLSNQRNRFPARRKFLKQSAALSASASASLAAPVVALAQPRSQPVALGLRTGTLGEAAARACRHAVQLGIADSNRRGCGDREEVARERHGGGVRSHAVGGQDTGAHGVHEVHVRLLAPGESCAAEVELIELVLAGAGSGRAAAPGVQLRLPAPCLREIMRTTAAPADSGALFNQLLDRADPPTQRAVLLSYATVGWIGRALTQRAASSSLAEALSAAGAQPHGATDGATDTAAARRVLLWVDTA